MCVFSVVDRATFTHAVRSCCFTTGAGVVPVLLLSKNISILNDCCCGNLCALDTHITSVVVFFVELTHFQVSFRCFSLICRVQAAVIISRDVYALGFGNCINVSTHKS